MTVAIRQTSETFTPRQQAVLTAALDLLVEAGDGLTMTAVARRASCSKETLYKWFGDRDGLLTATVQWQAAKVRVPLVDRRSLDPDSLRASIYQFARDLLATISGATSVALNRLAISHATEDNGLGAIVLDNGRFTMGKRLKPLLEAGRDARMLRFDNSETAFRTFFGLVLRDVQVRLLLGDKLALSLKEIEADAERATDQFLTLYGVPANKPDRAQR
ncbi:MAG: TetR family transcriptional regulator [Devosia sp. 67-54]|uniref:TetR/AcrR family transcriptional regulator n=1 Tax=unclassified Devosia TaxID=196773 RepID=UPI000969A17F|nr:MULTISPECIES: TetR/AcrR family transcriptional regulator [unclassified Devosia]MBN9303939.1 TetR/AcrR family transcriptional regulator [Devosia sp.]OJX17785.1 MAG: TetR family transcriptional regulator [Devosia sp. 67-54]